MTQARHSGFERTEAATTAAFAARAAATLSIRDLIALFAAMLAREGVAGHLCCVVAEDGALLPLVGDTPDLVGAARALDMPVAAIDGTPLLVRLAACLPLDAAAQARLALLCTLYAYHACPLMEVDGDSDGARRDDCARMAAAGRPLVDIADDLALSVPAVRILLARVAAGRDPT